MLFHLKFDFINLFKENTSFSKTLSWFCRYILIEFQQLSASNKSFSEMLLFRRFVLIIYMHFQRGHCCLMKMLFSDLDCLSKNYPFLLKTFFFSFFVIFVWKMSHLFLHSLSLLSEDDRRPTTSLRENVEMEVKLMKQISKN